MIDGKTTFLVQNRVLFKFKSLRILYVVIIPNLYSYKIKLLIFVAPTILQPGIHDPFTPSFLNTSSFVNKYFEC